MSKTTARKDVTKAEAEKEAEALAKKSKADMEKAMMAELMLLATGEQHQFLPLLEMAKRYHAKHWPKPKAD